MIGSQSVFDEILDELRSGDKYDTLLAEKAAAELADLNARLEAQAAAISLVELMKSDSAIKLVLPIPPRVTRKLYWATDVEQWEVYSHDPSNRMAITWHYKGNNLASALEALKGSL